MTVLTEGKHAGAFLVSEANGTRSRKTGTVAAGQNLVAGQVVQLSAGKLVAKDILANTGNTALITAPEGIMWDNVDASTAGPHAGADVAGAVYIARDAEVNGSEMTYPSGDNTAETGKTLINAALATLGIIVR